MDEAQGENSTDNIASFAWQFTVFKPAISTQVKLSLGFTIISITAYILYNYIPVVFSELCKYFQ